MRETSAASIAALEALRPRFEGQTALVFATGPDLPKLWRGRSSQLPKWAVKEAWQIVPDADVVYGCDQSWWVNQHELLKKVSAPKFGYQTVMRGVYPLRGTWGKTYIAKLGQLALNAPCNSGNQSVQLIAQLGAKRIVLVGFGMRGGHFYPDRRPPVASPWQGFVERFAELADELKLHGVEVLNATPGSALTLPYVDLDEVLNG